MEDINSLIERMLPLFIEYGLKVVGAVVILIAGWSVANWLSKKVQQQCEKSSKIDATLTPLLTKTTKILGMTVVIIFVLNMVGIQTASLVAILGAAGLAIGLAWQGTLADVAAGVMLLVMRPFNVGDAVDIDGTAGIAKEIGLVTTRLDTFDNVAIVMPNSNVWGNNIKNMSTNDTRRLDMVIGFDYDDDMDHAVRVAHEIVGNDERVLSEPEPQIVIAELAGSAVNMYVRPWVAKDDYWPTKFDLTKHFKERFDEEGISFPFPQRDVHLFQENE